MSRMRSMLIILSVCIAGMAAFAAVPAAVDAAVKQMQTDGAEVRAGFDKSLGVFVVASGTADITGSKAKAKTVARVNAVQRLGEFLGSQITAASRTRLRTVRLSSRPCSSSRTCAEIPEALL